MSWVRDHDIHTNLGHRLADVTKTLEIEMYDRAVFHSWGSMDSKNGPNVMIAEVEYMDPILNQI